MFRPVSALVRLARLARPRACPPVALLVPGALVLGALVLGALTALTAPGAGAVAGTAPAVPRTASPQAAVTLKPLLTGLMSREDAAPADVADLVRSYALRVSWKDLQPAAGARLDFTALDAQVQAAASNGARVRLRVFAGAASPGWARTLGGPAVDFVDPFDGKATTIPRFWEPAFGTAYADLQRQLAARYDGDPTVAEVVVSRCTAFYPEPFLRQLSIKANRTALLNAGYTVAADHACQREQVDAHAVWKATRSGLAFNPYQVLHPDQTTSVDSAFTAQMMTYCRTRLGARCVLANMSIRSPIAPLDAGSPQPYYQRMYAAMAAAGPPLAFQTAVEDRIGDCAATLEWAVVMHAASVELPKDEAGGGCTRPVLAAVDPRLGHATAPQSVTTTPGEAPTLTDVTWAAPAVTKP